MSKNMYEKLSFFEKIMWYISLLTLILIPTSIGTTIGLGNNVVLFANIFISLYLIYMFLKGNFQLEQINRINKIIIIYGLVVLFFLSKDYISFKYFLTYGILPFIIYSYMDKMSMEERKALKIIMISVYVLECLIAIYERVTLSNLFAPPDGYNTMATVVNFRAPALFGHPIRNAMVTSCMMLFILTSKSKDLLKLSLFILGFVALLCFNERGSIIVGLLCSFPYLIQIFKRSSIQIKITFGIGLLFFVLFLVKMGDSGLGGRLFSQKISIEDGSTMARFESLQAFSVLSQKEILWGGMDLIETVCIRLNMEFLENGPIAILLIYGLVFGIPIFILFIISQITILKEYTIKDKFLFLFLFHSVGFTNTGLSMSIIWQLYFFSYYAFNPKPIKSIESQITDLLKLLLLYKFLIIHKRANQ